MDVVLVGSLMNKSDQMQKELLQKNKEMEEVISRLDRASRKDELTQLKNRYALREDFSVFINKRVMVMMTDLDDLKEMNERDGHMMGDEALKEYAAILKMVFKEDSLYRYGDDEFLIITESSAAETAELVEQLSQKMKATKIHGTRIPIQMSAGYVLGECKGNDDLRKMIKQADRNMYKAKEKGKNRMIGS